MSIERANSKLAKVNRSVKLPGKSAIFTDKTPVEIAQELRSKSKLGRREGRLAAAEAKLRG